MLLRRHNKNRQVNVQAVEKQPDTKPVVEEEKVETPVEQQGEDVTLSEAPVEEKKATRRTRK